MKALLIYDSTQHGNTRKVCQACQEIGDIDLLDVADLSKGDKIKTEEYDLIGFGSGIFGGNFSKALMTQVKAIGQAKPGQKAFAFSTGSFDNHRSHKKIDTVLEKKGYTILDGFTVKAYNTFLLFKPVGGIAKGHPDQQDLEQAKVEMKRLLGC